MNNPGPKNAAEGSPVTDGNGDRPGADEALRRSEERYRALVEATGQAVWSWSADGTAGDLSRAEKWWEEVTGQTREEQRENPGAWLEVVHPEDREAARAARETALDQGKRYDIEYRVRARSGGCRHIHARGIPIRTAEGSVREWVGTLDDVTDRRRSVVELRESEARFRRLASAGIIGVIRWNLQSSLIVEANDEFLRMTGYDRADLVAGRLNFRSMTPPEWTARNELGVRDLLETGVGGAYEKEYFRKGGGRVAVIIVGVRFEDAANEGMSFVLDITERKRAEDDLRDSAALLRMAADAADAGVWVWDVQEDRVIRHR
jgi:PAS domain S-box-containing protein